MLPELTPAVSRALDVARRLAGAGEVQPLHLVLGLLEEEEGRAFTLAAAAGLDRGAFESWRGPPGEAASSPDRPLSAALLRVLRAARGVAVELGGDSTVSGEALLLAIVQNEPALRAELVRRGMNADRLEAELLGRKPAAPVITEPLQLSEPVENLDAARILDASANRAREGLRVVEDYCRFVLDDNVLCGELKHLRHGLTAALEELSPRTLLEARETQRDVGTAISTLSERHRAGLLEVVQASFKRVQEALRSIEEYGKVIAPRAAEAVEQIRYRAYTIEKAALLGSFARQRLERARLYVLLTGSTCAASLEWTIAEAAAGGVDIVQLREKALSDSELLKRDREVRRWTRHAGVLFIVNDRPDIARLAEADGVHLGQDDMPVMEARRILGPGALIGVSTHDLDQLRQAVLDGASYVGVGPCFASATKSFDHLAGMTYLRAASAATTLPAFAIGGINERTIGDAVEAGARRVAVSAAIASADDPQSAARQLRARLP